MSQWGMTRTRSCRTRPFVYASGLAPKGYRCQRCGGKGIKLWRLWNSFLSHQMLLCARCAAPGRTVDADGKSTSPIMARCGLPDWKSDQLEDEVSKMGSLAPAVPTEDGQTYWGYTSVPEPGCIWWKSLPTYKEPTP